MGTRLGTMIALAGVLAAGPAHAFSLGEVATTSAVQGTLARSGTTSAAGTIGTVKNALEKAVATKEGQLAGAGVQVGWGGKSGGAAWAAGGQAGWKVASANGWMSASAGGWTRAGGTSAWHSGGWNTH